MASPSVAIRCPACGADLAVFLAPSPPTQWFPCPHCHAPVPVVVPRDPPPLYSWEVLPGLYPTLPRPRPPRWQTRRAFTFALLAVVVLAVALAGVFAYYGFVASMPGRFTVSGTVYEAPVPGVTVPASGVAIVLTEDSGQTLTETTGPDGVFSFASVPAGGVRLNATLPGYAPALYDTFVSSVYDAGTQGIQITLSPGGVANTSSVSLSPFTTLEAFLASIGSGTLLLVLVAAVAGAAVVRSGRRPRPALGVIGGGAGLLAPFGLYLFFLGTAFPFVFAGTAALAAFGAFSLMLGTVEIAQTGPAPGPG
jgi:hypothetical protein